MATVTTAFSPKEWTIGIGEETTVGTAITTYLGIEFDSISFPAINDAVRITEKRNIGSTSRVVNADDLLYIEAGGIHEFSISGFLNKTIWPVIA